MIRPAAFGNRVGVVVSWLALAWAFIALPSMGACNGDGTPPGADCRSDEFCNSGEICCRSAGSDKGLCVTSCGCESQADCDATSEGLSQKLWCCQGTCSALPGGLACIDSADCAADEVCVREDETACFGACAAGNTGGGGAGGSGGAGGGGGGGGGAPPLISTYELLSGAVTMNGDGCLEAGGAPGGQIIFDQTMSGTTTITVTGRFLPVAGGPAAVALLQLCAGGALNGSALEGCHLARADQSTVDDTGGVAIYDTAFNEVASDGWTPTGTMHDYEFTAVADPDAQTITVSLSIDGVPAASVNAPNLGVPGADRIALTLLAVSVCSAVIN